MVGQFDPSWKVFHLSYFLGVRISCSSELSLVKQAAQ